MRFLPLWYYSSNSKNIEPVEITLLWKIPTVPFQSTLHEQICRLVLSVSCQICLSLATIWQKFWHSIWLKFWYFIQHKFSSFGILSGISFAYCIWHKFWHSPWHTFLLSFWQLRSSTAQTDRDLAVEVQHCLPTVILSWQLRSGKEDESEKEREEEEEGTKTV